MIHATTPSEALWLEVDALKQKEKEDKTMAVLSLDAKARLMGSVMSQVGKAWDIALAKMWEIQENLLESSTKVKALALPAPEASTSVTQANKATQLNQILPIATNANKET